MAPVISQTDSTKTAHTSWTQWKSLLEMSDIGLFQMEVPRKHSIIHVVPWKAFRCVSASLSLPSLLQTSPHYNPSIGMKLKPFHVRTLSCIYLALHHSNHHCDSRIAVPFKNSSPDRQFLQDLSTKLLPPYHSPSRGNIQSSPAYNPSILPSYFLRSCGRLSLKVGVKRSLSAENCSGSRYTACAISNDMSLPSFAVFVNSSKTYFMAFVFLQTSSKIPVKPFADAQFMSACCAGTTTATRQLLKESPCTQIWSTRGHLL